MAAAGELRSDPFAAEATAPEALGNDRRGPMEAAAGAARDCTPPEVQIAGQIASVHFQRVDRVVYANELPPMAGAAWNCRARDCSLSLLSDGMASF
jgi:hypothetical protein